MRNSTRIFLSLAVLAHSLATGAQRTIIAVTPSADAFVRSAAPASNYGGAGALSVSGSAATNALGDPQDDVATFMREHADQRRGEEIVLDAHLEQARDGAGGIVGVERREHQVAGE